MIWCILAFLGIYTAMLGIAGFALNMWWPIPLFGINIPLCGLCLIVGFLVSLCVLGFIRMMGELSGSEDPKVIYTTVRATAWLGFLSAIAVCAIQSYLRIEFSADKFLLHKSEWIADSLQLSDPTSETMLLFLMIALPVLIGISVFIFAFYAQSFDEYVTVHYVEMGGSDVEISRSDAYLPIWPTLLVGLVLAAVLIFLALTPLAYLLLIPFPVLLFGYPNKKKMITAAAITGAVAVVAVILTFAGIA